MSDTDPQCLTLACQAANGWMTWGDVFMFMFGALLVGAWGGYRFCMWRMANEVPALVVSLMRREGARVTFPPRP